MHHGNIYDVSEKLFNKFAAKNQMDKVDHIQKYFIQENTRSYSIYRITTYGHKLHIEMEKIKKDRVAGEIGYKFGNLHSLDRFLGSHSDDHIFGLIMEIDSKRGFQHSHHFEKTLNWKQSLLHISGNGEFKMVDRNSICF